MRDSSRTRTAVESAPVEPPSLERVQQAFVTALPSTGIRLYRDQRASGHIDVRITTSDRVGGSGWAPVDVSAGLPAYLLTAWNPGGRASTLEDNQIRQVALEDRIAAMDWKRSAAAVYDQNLAWAEPVVAVFGASRTTVLAVAAEFEQLAVIRLDGFGLEVLTAPGGERLTELMPLVSAEKVFTGCPMQSTWPLADELCQDVGGPYGSKAIAASGYWRYERRSLVSVLGCDLCHGGPIAGAYGSAGGGMLLNPVSVANRISGPVQLPSPPGQGVRRAKKKPTTR